MSRLPEKGDAAAAIDAMNARTDALGADGPKPLEGGTYRFDVMTGTTAEGADTQVMRGAYGDLFDVTELLDEGGMYLVQAFLRDIARGYRDPTSALASLLFQGTAIGVLMERARWERGS